MQPGPFIELLFIPTPGIPVEARRRFERGPMHMMFLRAGDGCDVQDLDVPLDDPALLVTVRAPLMYKGFTYQVFGTYEAPESPPEAPRFYLLGPGSVPQGAQYPLLVPISLIAWRRRVYHEQCALYLESRWSPTKGETRDIRGLVNDMRLDSVEHAAMYWKVFA